MLFTHLMKRGAAFDAPAPAHPEKLVFRKRKSDDDHDAVAPKAKRAKRNVVDLYVRNGPVIAPPCSMVGDDIPASWKASPHRDALVHQWEHGFAVFHNVVPKELITEAVEEIWDEMQRLVPEIDRHTQTLDEIRKRYPNSQHHILQQYGFGNLPAVCRAKYHDAVIDLFREMFFQPKDAEMLVSTDAISLMLPLTERGDRGWYHVDVNPQRMAQPILSNGAPCIQGLIVATHHLVPHPAQPGRKAVQLVKMHLREHGGLRLIEKSHHKLQEIWAHYGITQLDKEWYILHDPTDKEPKKNTNAKRRAELLRWFPDAPLDEHGEIRGTYLEAEPGSLLTWRSDMVHMGTRPENGQGDVVRCALYVCALPRSLATPEQLARKWKMAQEGRVTSHHPIAPRDFALKGRVYGTKDVSTKSANERAQHRVPVVPNPRMLGSL